MFGEELAAEGILKVDVAYEQQVQRLDLFVVNFSGYPLFGRSWLSLLKVDWETIKAVSFTCDQVASGMSTTFCNSTAMCHEWGLDC